MRYRSLPFVLVLFLGFSLIACDLSLITVTPPDDETGSPVPTPAEGVEVRIARAIDGDTVELDDGRRVRYIGVNTPERDQPFYEAATDANRRLVEGQAAWLVLDVQPTDRYGRTLAYVWLGDTFVNWELVRQGYATVYTEPPNVRYSEVLLAAQRAAREAERGLWAPADAPLKIQKIYYDAPGDDAQNPNGEWVEIRNVGTDAVNLGGFRLKDEATHIYTFPALELGPDQVLKLYSGPGTDTGSALYWGLEGQSVWNNDGDVAFLRDPQGRLVDSYEYGP